MDLQTLVRLDRDVILVGDIEDRVIELNEERCDGFMSADDVPDEGWTTTCINCGGLADDISGHPNERTIEEQEEMDGLWALLDMIDGWFGSEKKLVPDSSATRYAEGLGVAPATLAASAETININGRRFLVVLDKDATEGGVRSGKHSDHYVAWVESFEYPVLRVDNGVVVISDSPDRSETVRYLICYDCDDTVELADVGGTRVGRGRRPPARSGPHQLAAPSVDPE